MTAIITNRPTGTHSLPTEWLGARVVGWMWAICDGLDWWVCALTRDGSYKYSSSDGVMVDVPDYNKTGYAKAVCYYLNRHCDRGGAWLVGWVGKEKFVLLWKDHDGDLQIQNVCDVHWDEFRNWEMEDWAEQAEQAWAVFDRINREAGWQKHEQIKLAQGQRPAS